MHHDRRQMLGFGVMWSAFALAQSGCAKAGTPAAWSGFLARFVAADGRVIDTSNGGVSHSEGQGYGLLMAEAAGDRVAFDLILNWTLAALRRPDSGLLTWRYDPSAAAPTGDPNNATDGDILVAWALLRAEKRWPRGDYGRKSETLRAAILREATLDYGGLKLLLPGRQGFVQPDHVVVNPAYYVWPALDAFAVREPLWAPYIADGLRLLERAAFGQWRLPSDWVSIDAEGRAAPAPDRPPRFGFDALRVPLYLAWSKRTGELETYRRFWKEVESPTGWPAWVDVMTGARAEYPLSAGGAAIAGLILGRPASPPPPADSDYYSSSLAQLVRIARA